MGKFSAIAFGLTLVLAAPSVALAAPAPAAAAAPTAAYTTNDTTIGTLLADPAAEIGQFPQHRRHPHVIPLHRRASNTLLSP